MRTRRLLTCLLTIIGASLPLSAYQLTVAPGLVEAKADGLCSLAEAIDTASGKFNPMECPTIPESGSKQLTINLSGTYNIAQSLPVLAPNDPVNVTSVYFKGPAGLMGPGSSATTSYGLLRIKTIPAIPVTLVGIKLFGGKAAQGGGLFVESGSADFSGGEIYFNTATQDGGGAYVAKGATLTLINSKVYSNMATLHGGGLHVNGSLTLTGTGGTEVHNNVATGNGGGLYFSNGDLLKVLYSSVTDNTAATGGGIFSGGTGVFHLLNSTLSTNHAIAGAGGGLYINAPLGKSLLLHATIAYNTASNRGGGVYSAAGSVPRIDNSLIAHNSSGVLAAKECGGSFVGSHDNVIGGLPTTGCSTDPSTKYFALTDLPLAPLGLNGLLTKSHILLTGNKAIDLLDGSLNLDGNPLTDDQRHASSFYRPYNTKYDVGAMEYVSCPSCVGDYGYDNDGDGAAEQFDPDDGNPLVTASDKDGDGYSLTDEDCDDTDSTINPGAAESCGADGTGDGKDNDCDGTTDEALWYIDADEDGYAGGAGVLLLGNCSGPGAIPAEHEGKQFTTTVGDCDDQNNYTHPGSPEACNSTDDDCDGIVDDIAPSFCDDATACTADSCQAGQCTSVAIACDDNNYCTADSCDAVTGCAHAPIAGCDPAADNDGDGVTVGASDCNDEDAAIAPNVADDSCNFIDNNCNGTIDESYSGVKYQVYVDQDGDQIGGGDAVVVCGFPQGAAQMVLFRTAYNIPANAQIVQVGGDCNDLNSIVFPNNPAGDFCDDLDNDCDGTVDENNQNQFAIDEDQDGYGFGQPLKFCSPDDFPVFVTKKEFFVNVLLLKGTNDCADTNAALHPGQADIACNGIDEDCSGKADDGKYPTLSWWHDLDGDSFGDAAIAMPISAVCKPANQQVVNNNGDCDDTKESINPNAFEICGDGLDNNCDGKQDELKQWYQDADGDGFGKPSTAQSACAQPAGSVDIAGDCDDSAAGASINPAASETCNGKDDNCNGAVDDGAIGTPWYNDSDHDGFGVATTVLQACTLPAGFSAAAGDCDDGVAVKYPGAVELCNKMDDNCNGEVDDNCITPPVDGGDTGGGSSGGGDTGGTGGDSGGTGGSDTGAGGGTGSGSDSATGAGGGTAGGDSGGTVGSDTAGGSTGGSTDGTVGGDLAGNSTDDAGATSDMTGGSAPITDTGGSGSDDTSSDGNATPASSESGGSASSGGGCSLML